VQVVLFLFTLAVAAVLRSFYLGQPLAVSEAALVVDRAGGSLFDAFTAAARDGAAPFGALLTWAAVRVLGDAEWAVRAPAVIAGLLSVVLVYIAARRVYGQPEIALLAMGIAAGLPVLVVYSNVAGGDLWAVVFTLSAFVCAHRVVFAAAADDAAVSDGLLLAAAAALAVFSGAGGVLAMLALLGWGVLHCVLTWQWRRLAAFIVAAGSAAALAVFLYLPLLITETGMFVFAPLTTRTVGSETSLSFIRGFSFLNAQLIPFFAVVLAVLAALGVFLSSRAAVAAQAERAQAAPRGETVSYLVFALAAWAVLTLVFRRTPDAPLVLFAAPFVALTAAAGAWALVSRFLPVSHAAVRQGFSVFSAVVPIGLWMTAERPPFLYIEQAASPHVAQAAAAVLPGWTAETRLLTDDAAHAPLRYAFVRAGAGDVASGILNLRDLPIYAASLVGAPVFVYTTDAEAADAQARAAYDPPPEMVFVTLPDLSADGELPYTALAARLRTLGLAAQSTDVVITNTGTLEQAEIAPLGYGEIVVDEPFDAMPERLEPLVQLGVASLSEGALDIQNSDAWLTFSVNEPVAWRDMIYEARVRPVGEQTGTFSLNIRQNAVGTYYVYISPDRTQTYIAAYNFVTGEWLELARAPIAPSTDGWDAVRIETVGDRILVSVNGQKALDVRDDRYPAGTAAFTVPPLEHVQFDDVRLLYNPATQPPDLTLTFTGPADAQGIPGGEGWVLEGAGQVVQDETGREVFELGSDNWTVFTYPGGDTWSAYSLELEFRILSPGVQSDLGELIVQTHWRPDVGSMNLSTDIDTEVVSIGAEAAAGGWLGELARAFLPVTRDGWHTLRIEADGLRVSATIDGMPMPTVEDAPFTRGGVRILVPPGTRVRIDDVRVRALAGEGLAEATPEAAPQATEAAPQATEAAPQATEAVPQATEAAPQATEAASP
jgi:4-amino-4-deoxy-L-arabinose transferase-like glycosyltransferase